MKSSPLTTLGSPRRGAPGGSSAVDPGKAPAGEAAFVRFLGGPRLPLWVALFAFVLASPSLFIGWHLDDYIARYIYSDLPGAEWLHDLYAGGYGLTNGVPADNHYQIETGHAPWWTPPDHFIKLWRPVSLVTHVLDARAWPDSPFLMHLQSLLWLVAMVLAAARTFRGMMGPVVGGFAALLLAFDHTHGFTVGFICNRYALISATFGLLALDQHHRFCSGGSRVAIALGPLLYLMALLSGESGVTIAAYAGAYTLFVDRSPLVRRALAFLPYLLVTVTWRAYYNLAGYGAGGSGVYIDPVREPVQFLAAFVERAPVLTLGQFLTPPPEMFPQFAPGTARLVWAFGLLVCIGLLVAIVPLLRRDRFARLWALGFVLALVPASSTHPHGRQLLLPSIGAMALVAQLWNLHAFELRGAKEPFLARFSLSTSSIVLAGHLVLSPIAAPFASASVAMVSSLHRAADDIGDEARGRDVVFVTAPDFFAVRLYQLRKRNEGGALPRRIRALSAGGDPIDLTRADERTLLVRYEGGLLGRPLSELFRDRRLAMRVGERVDLEGLSIEVLAVTPEGRAETVRFRFTDSLDSETFLFYRWENAGFVPMRVPEVGGSIRLPAPPLEVGFGDQRKR